MRVWSHGKIRWRIGDTDKGRIGYRGYLNIDYQGETYVVSVFHLTHAHETMSNVCQIIRCHLYHPAARMVVDCVDGGHYSILTAVIATPANGIPCWIVGGLLFVF